MQLTSFVFLFGLLPLCLAGAFLLRRHLRAQNALLLTVSLLFCAASGIAGLLAALLELLAVFVLAKALARAAAPRQKKQLLALGIVFAAGLLCYFKYTNFLRGMLRLPSVQLLPAPAGVSFLTFLLISYLIDVFRGTVPASTQLDEFLLYVFFFPKALQGPLCRYGDFSAQLQQRVLGPDDAADGAARLVLGLGKKVLLSAAAGAVAQEAFSLPAAALSPVYAWMGAVCYALQIYFDFSGYTDMALGLGRMLGFHLPENFNHPYTAVSVTDFWRRWHISLSSWFRDYVYIPLGGSRRGKARQIFNLLVVWSLTGLWHGANWTFLIWGLWFFFLLAMEKLWLGRLLEKLPRVCGHIYALLAVLIGWVFFNSRSLSYALSFLRALIVPGADALGAACWLQLSLWQHGPALAIGILLCTAWPSRLWARLSGTQAGRALQGLLLLIILALSALSLTSSGVQAFIYAQF